MKEVLIRLDSTLGSYLYSTGVTIVQYRDKTSETAELIRTGRKLHEVTREKGIPLLVNDRVDVALAIGAEGVHIGQEDISKASFGCFSYV